MNSHVPGRSGRSVQEIWEDFSLSFTPAVREVVEFAKHIPGFQALSQHDQVTLLKAGTFEVRPGMARAGRRAWCPMALPGAPRHCTVLHGLAWSPKAWEQGPRTWQESHGIVVPHVWEPRTMEHGTAWCPTAPMASPGASHHCSAPYLGSVAQNTVSLSWHGALWTGMEPCSTAVLHKPESWVQRSAPGII